MSGLKMVALTALLALNAVMLAATAALMLTPPPSVEQPAPPPEPQGPAPVWILEIDGTWRCVVADPGGCEDEIGPEPIGYRWNLISYPWWVRAYREGA